MFKVVLVELQGCTSQLQYCCSTCMLPHRCIHTALPLYSFHMLHPTVPHIASYTAPKHWSHPHRTPTLHPTQHSTHMHTNTIPPAETCTDPWKLTLLLCSQWRDRRLQEWQLQGTQHVNRESRQSAMFIPPVSTHLHRGTPSEWSRVCCMAH